MDHVNDIHQVQHSEPSVHSVRAEPEANPRLKLLVIRDEMHAAELLAKYHALSIPKEHVQLFQMHLLGRRDSVFHEVGDNEGLVFFTNVMPRYKATFGLLFWDRKLSARRRAAVREGIVDAFKNFELVRVQADISAKNAPMRTFLQRLGFVYEGTLRSDWVDESGIADRLTFGLLRQEL